MVPAFQFENWQWLALNLATPVVLWGGWPFHKAAWANLKHGAATMDTLVSVGVLSAWLWSLYALFIGDAGMPGMRMDFQLIPDAGSGADEIYLETASVVTTFILAGRWFEARAEAAARAPRSRRCSSWAPRTPRSSTPTGPSGACPSTSCGPATCFVVRPGEKVATDGAGRAGQLGRRHEHAHR